jgi:hypothetical protein
MKSQLEVETWNKRHPDLAQNNTRKYVYRYRREMKMIRNKSTFSVGSISTMWSSSLSSGLFFPLTLLFTFATADDKYNNRLDTTATNAGPLTTVFTQAASCAPPGTVANYGYPYLLPGCEGLYRGECCPQDGNTMHTSVQDAVQPPTRPVHCL